jgi:hypothetical protein
VIKLEAFDLFFFESHGYDSVEVKKSFFFLFQSILCAWINMESGKKSPSHTVKKKKKKNKSVDKPQLFSLNEPHSHGTKLMRVPIHTGFPRLEKKKKQSIEISLYGFLLQKFFFFFFGI